MPEENPQPFHEEILLLAEKLGEVTDRLARIENEHATQTAPLDAAKGAQDSALKSLEAALVGLRALNFHVLDNNLGAVSSRLSEVEKQADVALKSLEKNLTATRTALESLSSETARKLSAVDSARTELETKRTEQQTEFAARVDALRNELSAAQTALTDKIELAKREFATPQTLNPSGKYDANRLYKRLDLVEFNGSSYLSREDDNKEQPGKNAKKWQLIARRGGAGGGPVNVVGGSGDVAGPASSTDSALALFSGTDGKMLKSGPIISSNNGDLSIPSTATLGLRLFNTVDQVTNFERLELIWSGNDAFLRAVASGSGTPRVLRLGTLSTGTILRPTGTTSGFHQLASTSTATAGAVGVAFTGFTSTASSGTAIGNNQEFTVNQSGAAGYTAFRVNVTETVPGGGGSGTKLLMQLGTAASASLVTADNAGRMTVASQFVITPLALTQASPTAIDFSLSNERDITLTGDIEFTTSNLAAGRSVTIYITADGSERTFTFPGDWVFVGTEPTTIAANKRAVLTLSSRSTTDASVRAAYSVEA